MNSIDESSGKADSQGFLLARELELMEVLVESPDVRQADLASRLGVAVGTINWMLKRMTAKGLVKAKRISRWQWRYLMTPKGLREKAKLTHQYVQVSLRLYRQTREEAKQLLTKLQQAGHTAVRFPEGEANDLLDIYKLTCSELGIDAVTDRDGNLPALELRNRAVVLKEGGAARSGSEADES